MGTDLSASLNNNLNNANNVNLTHQNRYSESDSQNNTDRGKISPYLKHCKSEVNINAAEG
jgi:hypothetical protein